MELTEGRKVAAVWFANGKETITRGTQMHQALEMVVHKEFGQTSFVPWIKVTLNTGMVSSINCATLEGVTFMPDDPQEISHT